MKNNKQVKIFSFFILFVLVYTIFIGVHGEKKETNLKKYTDVKYPTGKHKYITSYFGYRISPFNKGYKVFHNGIDIAAPHKTEIISLSDGVVTISKFYGGYGYTVCVKTENTVYLYGHLDENIFVKKGDHVMRGDVIALVGPKNVYNVPNNPFKDIYGLPTNGFTTGPHLHLSYIVDGKFIDPMVLFKNN